MVKWHSLCPDLRRLENKFKEWGWLKKGTKLEWTSLAKDLKRKNLVEEEVDVLIDIRPAKKQKKSLDRYADPPSLSAKFPGRSMSQDIVPTQHVPSDRFLISLKPPKSIRPVEMEGLPFFRFLRAVGVNLADMPKKPPCLSENATGSQSAQLVTNTSISGIALKYTEMLTRIGLCANGPLQTTSSRSYDLSCLLSKLCPQSAGTIKNSKTEVNISNLFLKLEPYLPQSKPGQLANALRLVKYGGAPDAALVLGVYLINLVSNNFSDEMQGSEVREVFASIFRTQTDLGWLKSLIDQGQPTAKILRQRLFHHAIETMDILLVKRLLAVGVDLNTSLVFEPWGTTRQTALQYTSGRYLPEKDKRQREDFLSDLLALKANPNLCGSHGIAESNGLICECMPINLCCQVSSCSSLIRSLLLSGSLVGDEFDLTAAITKGLQIEELDMLLEAGASVHGTKITWESFPKETQALLYPLQAALEIDNIDVANRLLDAGADALWQPHKAIVCLREDCGVSNDEISSLLVKFTDPMGPPVMAPLLTLAVRSGRQMVVERLLDAGADPDYCLRSAIKQIENVFELRCGWDDRCCDPTELEIMVPTALASAVGHKDAGAVRMLLNKSNPANEIHPCGYCDRRYVLREAACASNYTIVKALLDYGFVDEVLDDKHNNEEFVAVRDLRRFSEGYRVSTAIAAAAASSEPKVLELLLHHGSKADDCAGSRGLTALQAACFFKKHDNIEYLLTRTKANVLHPGAASDGISAIAAAVYQEDWWTYQRLMSHLRCGRIATSCLQQSLLFAVSAKDQRFFDDLTRRLGANINSADMVREGATSIQSFLRMMRAGLQLFTLTENGPLYEVALEAAFCKGCFEVAQCLLPANTQLHPRLAIPLLGRTSWFNLEKELWSALTELLVARTRWEACSKAEKNRILKYVLSNSHVQAGNVLFHGTVPVHETLLKVGFEADPEDDYEGPLPVQLAIDLGHVGLLRLLVENGANLCSTRKCVFPGSWMEECSEIKALQRAAFCGNIDMLSYLLGHGCDPRESPAQCEHGQTALAAAFEQNNTDICMMLLDAGADPNDLTNDGVSILQDASDRHNSFGLVARLIEKGADVNAAYLGNKFARTALQAACEGGNIEVVKLLLRKGANVNAPAADDSGVTALQAAAIKGYIEIARLLISQGADIAAPGARIMGRTALEGAAEKGRFDMVELLLIHYPDGGPSATVCAKASQYAFKRGHDVIAEQLLDYCRTSES